MKSIKLVRYPMLTIVGILAFLSQVATVSASEVQKPAGPVVLTIVGKIDRTNRPAFDETQDLFFKYHERKFERAFEFDRTMLEALGMTTAEIAYIAWPRRVTVEGPLLRDVLAMAGAKTGKIRMTALDGFASELEFKDLAEQEWIVALKADGRPLSIGQRGPAWMVYARRDGKAGTTEDELRWPWAAFLIEIE
jgi:hypothetical protein